MRFALIATSAAAAVAVPLAMQAAAPQMSGEQFLTDVRCAAYEDVIASSDGLAEAKRRLNAEARRQPARTAAQAEAAVESIALQAVNSTTAADAAMMRRERMAACSGALFATGAEGSGAV